MAVYGHMDIWFGYFTIRKMTLLGDKAACQYLDREDPAFLQIYQQFLSTSDREEKLVLYEKAAALATAPLGGLWPGGSTVFNQEHLNEFWEMLTWEKE